MSKRDRRLGDAVARRVDEIARRAEEKIAGRAVDAERESETSLLRAQVSSQAREIERIKGRLARVLRYAHGYFGHMGTGVWSRRRSGG
jgi:hypothetical protein